MSAAVFLKPLKGCFWHAANVANRKLGVKGFSCRDFSYRPTRTVVHRKHTMKHTRTLKPQLLLAENIRTLLYRRRLDASALAAWCGHKPPWISKVLSGGRGVRLPDLGKIADFFGVTVADLFQHGISEIAERRKAERRTGVERRSSTDRRQPIEGRLHPDLQPRFPPRRDTNDDGTGGRRFRLPPTARPGHSLTIHEP
jgi:hypothetical protein